jgi:hypothetical protein
VSGLAELVITENNSRDSAAPAMETRGESQESRLVIRIVKVEHREFRTFSCIDRLSTSKCMNSRLVKSVYSDGLVTSKANTVKRAATAKLGRAAGGHRKRVRLSTRRCKQAIASLLCVCQNAMRVESQECQEM